MQIIKGEIPKDLKGVLYRNSVSTKKRKNGYPGHLFDGVWKLFILGWNYIKDFIFWRLSNRFIQIY